ncbi:MAG: hypothetical protein KDA20_07590 [Phycisphaerales bacterium]|nr:hypothetical protein [Phycisphaerales bacterium]
MGQLRKALETIAAAMTKLNASQRMLIGSLAVVMAMTLFVVAQYTSKPDMVPLLPGLAGDERSRIEQFLRVNYGDAGYAVKDGELVVPVGSQRSIMAALASEGKAPGDTRLFFETLIDKQKWSMPSDQREQMTLIAKQNELAKVISMMSGVTKASVIADVPSKRGLGAADRPPTASVTVFAPGGLSPETVDAVAHLVQSSFAGMSLDNVRVIDGVTNRQHTARSQGALATSLHEQNRLELQRNKQAQLADMLRYIPGVIVTVQVQADTRKEVSTTREILPEDSGTVKIQTSQTGTSMSSQNTRGAGEAGARSNNGMDIAGTTQAGTSTNETNESSQFETKFGDKVSTIEDGKGYATRISAVVNIPRPYFVALWRQRQPAAEGGASGEEAEPVDTDLQPIIDGETQRIEGEVAQLIDSSAQPGGSPGVVRVSMIPVLPDAMFATSGVSSAGALGLPATGPLALDQLVKTVGIGGLAVVALALMVVTAVKGNKREPLPTAAELVGIPPALDDGGDLIGEAAEADSVLAGIELTDDELKSRKVMEQVGDMIDNDSKQAATLLSRWVANAT